LTGNKPVPIPGQPGSKVVRTELPGEIKPRRQRILAVVKVVSRRHDIDAFCEKLLIMGMA
jgi:hypothetical protein